MKNSVVAMGKSTEVPQHLIKEWPYDWTILLDMYPEEVKPVFWRDIGTANVHFGIIHNSQDMETA
jgi:hypothetical protein